MHHGQGATQRAEVVGLGGEDVKLEALGFDSSVLAGCLPGVGVDPARRAADLHRHALRGSALRVAWRLLVLDNCATVRAMVSASHTILRGRRSAWPPTVGVLAVAVALSASGVAGCAAKSPANEATAGIGVGGADGQSSGGAVATRTRHAAGTKVTVTSEDGTTYEIEQGVPGDPASVGCADGQREGLLDVAAHPSVAGCAADWIGAQSMRAAKTGRACGDDLAPCVVPADACAAGWHVCGADGRFAEVLALGATACHEAGGARYVTALSHCETQVGCTYDARATGGNGDGRYGCFQNGWCSEAICCGRGCGELGVCADGLWPGATHIARGTDQGCGAMTSHRAGAVLCCKDG